MNGEGAERPRKDTLKQVLTDKPTSIAQAHLVALGTMQKCRRRLEETWQGMAATPAGRDAQCTAMYAEIHQALSEVAESEADTLAALDRSIHSFEMMRARLQAQLRMNEEASDLLALLAALRAVHEHLSAMVHKNR